MSDRKGAVTTSLLQKLCHKDDSILLGSWMQDTDHKDVEEQVSIFFCFVIIIIIFIIEYLSRIQSIRYGNLKFTTILLSMLNNQMSLNGSFYEK